MGELYEKTVIEVAWFSRREAPGFRSANNNCKHAAAIGGNGCDLQPGAKNR